MNYGTNNKNGNSNRFNNYNRNYSHNRYNYDMTYTCCTWQEIQEAIRKTVKLDPENKTNDVSLFKFIRGRHWFKCCHCNEIHLDTYYCKDGFDSTRYKCILCNKHVTNTNTDNQNGCLGFNQSNNHKENNNS